MKARGFTVVEIIIVIAIIAILINFMLVSVRGMQADAEISRVQADLRTIQVALEAYNKNHAAFPPTGNFQSYLVAESSKIIDGVLVDPFTNNQASSYGYQVSANGIYYAIFSVGVLQDGSVTIDNSGLVTTTGQAIVVTNGRKE